MFFQNDSYKELYSRDNTLVAFYDIHERKWEVLPSIPNSIREHIYSKTFLKCIYKYTSLVHSSKFYINIIIAKHNKYND
jgi:hypothetical protein